MVQIAEVINVFLNMILLAALGIKNPVSFHRNRATLFIFPKFLFYLTITFLVKILPSAVLTLSM